MQDPILTEDEQRYVMFPLKAKPLWELYKKSVDCFWRTEEVDTSQDAASWEKLSSQEQGFIKMILAFFAASDGLVIENLGLRFLKEVQLAEARAFYSFQMAMENIHSEMYSILIDTYVQSPEEKTKLFSALKEFPCIRKKGDWAKKWIAGGDSFARRLVAFACIEGIFFSGAFCSIYWLKKRGLMPGLSFSNELISRDEALHTEFAVALYNQLVTKLPESELLDIVKEAVNIEIEFICEALPCRLIGMNADLMSTYIKFVADRLLRQLGAGKHYGVQNPFDFMELISIEGKTNFFEKRVSDYSLPTTSGRAEAFGFSGEF